jgi:hypothetical protein
MTCASALRFAGSVLPAAIFVSAAGCGSDALNTSSSEGGVVDSSSAPPSGDAEAGTGDAGASCPIEDGGTEDGRSSAGRVPMNHRSAGAACPEGRGAVSPEASTCTAPDGGTCGPCAMDSDCTAGTNGRCFTGRFAYRSCSYDQCFSDSDCDAGGPCECRTSSSSTATNVCLTGSNCRDDSDCGPGGYCSPSVPSLSCACLSTELCGDAGGGCYEFTGSGPVGTPPGPGWTGVPCSCGDSCGHGYFCHTRCDACVDDSDCGDGQTCNYDTLSNRWECSECLPFP